MATNFPASLDNFTNPTAADNLNTSTVTHTDQHANINDAVEALEAKVGVTSSAVVTSLDFLVANVIASLNALTASLGSAAFQPTSAFDAAGLASTLSSAAQAAAIAASQPVGTTLVVDDVATNATMFPVWVTTASGNVSTFVSSTKFRFNPSFGSITVTGNITASGFFGTFVGSLVGNATTVTGLSITSGKTLTSTNTLTLAGTDGSTLTIGTGGTLGTGAFANISLYALLISPSFTTPSLGAATATTINGVTITGSGTLAVSTFTLTVAGTASVSGTNTGDNPGVTSIATTGLATGGTITGTGTITVTASTASDQETATSTTTCVTPSVQQRHPSAAKGWVRYNGVTNTIITSYNLNSVTDGGVGDYTYNWEIDFSSENYCIIASASADGTTYFNAAWLSSVTLPTAGATRIRYGQLGLSYLDEPLAMVSVYGDQ